MLLHVYVYIHMTTCDSLRRRARGREEVVSPGGCGGIEEEEEVGVVKVGVVDVSTCSTEAIPSLGTLHR